MTSLTAANAVITLTIPGVFNSPQQLQQFAADDATDTDTITTAQVQMGVDGFLSGGFVYVEVKQGYTLQGDSPSNFIFDQWAAAQQAAQDTFVANGVLLLKSLGTKWTWTRGFLTQYKPAPDVKKILQPRKYEITWQRMAPQPS